MVFQATGLFSPRIDSAPVSSEQLRSIVEPKLDSVYCDSSRETNMKLRRETADVKSIMKSKKRKSENEKEEVSQEEIVENVSLADDKVHIISKQKKKKRKTAEEEDEGNSIKETHSESPKRKRKKKKKRVKMVLEDSASVDESETEEKIVEEETTLRVRPLSNTDEAVAERKKLKAEKKLLRNVQKEDTKATNALEYLNAWKNDRSNWKFKKALQIFLINNCLDSNRVPDSHFPLLLDYFENLQGNARNIARDSALLTISIKEEPSHSSDDHSSDEVIERAKQIVSLLQS